MFRTRSSISSPAVVGTGVALLTAIVIATGLNLWLVVEIRKEQNAIGEIVRGGVQEDIQRLGTLPAELGWQLIFTLVVLAVLVVAATTLVFFVRTYTRSQTTLRDTVTLSRDILSSIDYGVITTDTEGLVTSINPQALGVLTLTTAPLGVSLAAITPDELHLAEICQMVLDGETAVHDQEFTVMSQDYRRDLRVDCHLLCGANGHRQGTVLHLREVTHQKLLEQRMRRMERFLGLGTLAAGLHHEIKNPLSALSLHVQLLEEDLTGQIDQRQAENLNVLKAEVTRIAGVLESFRDYASNEQLNTSSLDVVQIVQRTVDLIKPQATEQQVEVTWGSDSPLPQVEGDAVRLEQVFLNLAINALEAMPHGGCLSFYVRPVGEEVVISVTDTGVGIPEDIQRFVLDPYFTTRSSGSGMGLAVCDKILRQHSGQLSFCSGATGTVFQITLPTVPQP